MVASDSWGDTSPLPPVDDEYQGRRRRGQRRGTSRPGRAGWLVVLGVVLSLSAAVAVPFLVAGGGSKLEPEAGGTSPDGTAPRTSLSPFGSGLVVVPAPSATPTAEVSEVVSGTPSATSAAPTTATTTNPPTTTTTTTTAPPLFSTTLQAESGSRSGCAQVRTVSGVSVVDRLGEGRDWSWGCRNTWGTVTFNNVSLPAGTYTITVYYVFGLFDGDESRGGRLRIDPDGAGSVIDRPNEYSRVTTCCQGWTTPQFSVSAGTFDISFTNPGGDGPDRAPALDRIVIQQTS